MTVAPIIGIIVPIYKHSGLAAEALASLMDQQDAPSAVVVMINDGDQLSETDLVCNTFAGDHSGLQFNYLKRRNGGLSAARNSGIDFLTSRYPSIEAIYFLDADNRLQSYALSTMAAALVDHPEADWFYPDINMFGLDNVSQYRGEYSALIHQQSNICEAGSLVRRRVFAAGVRFDEDMRRGYEDWEFWLSAQAKGFRGRNIPDLGLR